jgi:hypothetical protein
MTCVYGVVVLLVSVLSVLLNCWFQLYFLIVRVAPPRLMS